MVLSHQWWERQFRCDFVPQVRALIETLEGRLLPTFANVEAEAKMKTEEEWERLCSLPASDDIEMSDLAERAFETGLAHYEMMTGLRQGLQNMFAAAFFHLYEQQVMLFHRRQVLHPTEENDPKLFKHSVFRQRLLQLGMDITAFASWAILEELGLAANTVKHAGGDSATKLHARRPDLFKPPALAGLSFHGVKSPARVFTPLMGEDIYVSISDLKRYAQAVEQFWEELLNTMAGL